MQRIIRTGIVFILGIMCAPPARAQDAYYWTQQYGGASSMLGGAVIGAAVDLGATYYNPAALLFVEPTFAANVQGYEHEWIRITTESELTRDFRQTRLRATPSLAAFALPKWGDNTFALSVLSRQSNEQRFTARGSAPVALFGQPAPGNTAAELVFDQTVNDWWVGVSWARALSSIVSVGATPYVATRQQRTDILAVTQSTGSGGETALVLREREAGYWAIRLLAKAGVYARLRDLGLGLTITSPGVDLIGRGDAYVQHAVANADVLGDGTLDADAFAAKADGLESRFHSPWSVGSGASYTWEALTLYLSAEWYAAVDGYDVLATTLTDPRGAEERAVLRHAADSVVNWGTALRVAPWETTALYASFVRDNSAHASGDTNLSLSTWDYNRVRAGAAFQLAWAEIALGVGYRWAEGDLASPFDVPLLGRARVRDRVLDVLLGLTIGEGG